MKKSNQKLKLLYLALIFAEKTDEEHTITVPEIIRELEKYDISAERKSLYDDLECLKLFGYDICSVKSRTTGYYLASRDFELPELKLLVDSVQSSKFITSKKSMELISKIEKLTSKECAKKLHRQVYVTNRVKTLNEQIYYNVDRIHDAIVAGKQITFRYFNYDLSKNKVYKKDGEFYTESPVSLTWDDENYYLITYKEKYSGYTHYRVDKMENIQITDMDRVLENKNFDITEYSKKMFQMFGGEETRVSMEFSNDLVGVVYDKFGIDIPVVKSDDSHFVCHINVAVSPNFLSWIMSFGDKAKVIAPQNVVDELCNLADKIRNLYDR